MSEQRYTNPEARQRMAAGTCPECGSPVSAHTGWGGPGCSLTDNGAAARIAQYQADTTRSGEHIMPVATQNPETMPAAVHGEAVVSAFRHLPLYGRRDDTYTVITRDGASAVTAPRYSVFRARFAPILDRWSIDTEYPVDTGLPWRRAAALFTSRIDSRVS
jgi:hypothetical protein